MFGFGGKPKKNTQAIVKQQQRELKKEGRGLEREIKKLDREEKKIKNEMQRAAKKGNQEEVKILAKSIVKLRKTKEQLRYCVTQNKAMGYELTSVVTNEKLVKSMKGTTKVTKQMNAIMKPAQVQKDIQQFQMEKEKMNLTAEMVDDLMDDAFDDNKEEVDDVINQLDDELALEINKALAESTGKKLVAEKETREDVDIQTRLDQLMNL